MRRDGVKSLKRRVRSRRKKVSNKKIRGGEENEEKEIVQEVIDNEERELQQEEEEEDALRNMRNRPSDADYFMKLDIDSWPHHNRWSIIHRDNIVPVIKLGHHYDLPRDTHLALIGERTPYLFTRSRDLLQQPSPLPQISGKQGGWEKATEEKEEVQLDPSTVASSAAAYREEMEINDLPHDARRRITHRETLGIVSRWSGATVTTKGRYYTPSSDIYTGGEGEGKQYLLIEGPTESSLMKAKSMVKMVLDSSNVDKAPS